MRSGELAKDSVIASSRAKKLFHGCCTHAIACLQRETSRVSFIDRCPFVTFIFTLHEHEISALKSDSKTLQAVRFLLIF